MGKFFKLFGVLFVVLFLTGCASLSELARDIQTIDPTAEIAAVSTLISDFVDQPWDNIILITLGYGMALLRRMYKKKKGAK